MPGELRQPPLLLVDIVSGPMDTRESNKHPVTKSVQGVVRPCRWDANDRQTRPVGKLRSDKATHERLVGIDLIGMHLHVRQTPPPPPNTDPQRNLSPALEDGLPNYPSRSCPKKSMADSPRKRHSGSRAQGGHQARYPA